LVVQYLLAILLVERVHDAKARVGCLASAQTWASVRRTLLRRASNLATLKRSSGETARSLGDLARGETDLNTTPDVLVAILGLVQSEKPRPGEDFLQVADDPLVLIEALTGILGASCPPLARLPVKVHKLLSCLCGGNGQPSVPPEKVDVEVLTSLPVDVNPAFPSLSRGLEKLCHPEQDETCRHCRAQTIGTFSAMPQDSLLLRIEHSERESEGVVPLACATVADRVILHNGEQFELAAVACSTSSGGLACHWFAVVISQGAVWKADDEYVRSGGPVLAGVARYALFVRRHVSEQALTLTATLRRGDPPLAAASTTPGPVWTGQAPVALLPDAMRQLYPEDTRRRPGVVSLGS
jgi:hypothetical protein